jgi:nucleotide-binding universal stress UspA family protein
MKALVAFTRPGTGSSIAQIASKLEGIREIHVITIWNQKEKSIPSELNRELGEIATLLANSSLPFKISMIYGEDIAAEIQRAANEINVDVVLLGASNSLYSKDLFGGRVAEVMKNFNRPVYILANKNLSFPYEPVLITCNEAPYQFLTNNEALSGLSLDSIPLLANQIKQQEKSFWDLKGDFDLDKRWLNPYNLIVTDYKTYSLHNEFFIDESEKSCLVYYN